VDLNADLGESFGAWRLGDDEALLDVVTSANVACGFHAGDPSTMRRVCVAAASRGVAIGAQVGYRDLAGFGRRRIDYEFGELRDDILYQIAALEGIARVAGARVSYVKPHGALYNVAATDANQAGAVVAAVAEYDFGLPVLTLPGSELARQAFAAGLAVVGEGFADRAYTPEGRLAPRSQEGAVLHDPNHVAARAVDMSRGVITANDGTLLAVDVSSICVHGDTPGAVAIASAVRHALTHEGIELRSFAA
jgi:5-oxoprolinase (ATP-hydrolysing) subunit A